MISIIIINYKTVHFIDSCIQSIIKYEKQLDFEIIIVDNNSNDNIRDIKTKFPDIKLSIIPLDYNSGFSRANNIGIKKAKGEYILLLNSDTYLNQPNTIKNTLNFLKSKSKKDVVAPVLLHQDLSYQCSARSWFFGWKDLLYANPFFIYFTRKKANYRGERNKKDAALHKQTGEVTWINGAFQLFNREIIDKNQLYYDNDFFLYGEDVEWAYRVKQNGGKFYLLHTESLIHLGSASSTNINSFKTAQIELSNWLFIKKSYGRFYFFLYTLLDWCNIFTDDLLYFLKKNNTESEKQNLIIRKIKKYLYAKYWLSINTYKSPSADLKFNVYENDKEFISKQTH